MNKYLFTILSLVILLFFMIANQLKASSFIDDSGESQKSMQKRAIHVEADFLGETIKGKEEEWNGQYVITDWSENIPIPTIAADFLDKRPVYQVSFLLILKYAQQGSLENVNKLISYFEENGDGEFARVIKSSLKKPKLDIHEGYLSTDKEPRPMADVEKGEVVSTSFGFVWRYHEDGRTIEYPIDLPEEEGAVVYPNTPKPHSSFDATVSLPGVLKPGNYFIKGTKPKGDYKNPPRLPSLEEVYNSDGYKNLVGKSEAPELINPYGSSYVFPLVSLTGTDHREDEIANKDELAKLIKDKDILLHVEEYLRKKPHNRLAVLMTLQDYESGGEQQKKAERCIAQYRKNGNKDLADILELSICGQGNQDAAINRIIEQGKGLLDRSSNLECQKDNVSAKASGTRYETMREVIARTVSAAGTVDDDEESKAEYLKIVKDLKSAHPSWIEPLIIKLAEEGFATLVSHIIEELTGEAEESEKQDDVASTTNDSTDRDSFEKAEVRSSDEEHKPLNHLISYEKQFLDIFRPVYTELGKVVSGEEHINLDIIGSQVIKKLRSPANREDIDDAWKYAAIIFSVTERQDKLHELARLANEHNEPLFSKAVLGIWNSPIVRYTQLGNRRAYWFFNLPQQHLFQTFYDTGRVLKFQDIHTPYARDDYKRVAAVLGACDNQKWEKYLLEINDRPDLKGLTVEILNEVFGGQNQVPPDFYPNIS